MPMATGIQVIQKKILTHFQHLKCECSDRAPCQIDVWVSLSERGLTADVNVKSRTVTSETFVNFLQIWSSFHLIYKWHQTGPSMVDLHQVNDSQKFTQMVSSRKQGEHDYLSTNYSSTKTEVRFLRAQNVFSQPVGRKTPVVGGARTHCRIQHQPSCSLFIWCHVFNVMRFCFLIHAG